MNYDARTFMASALGMPVGGEGITFRQDQGWPYWMPWMEGSHFRDYLEVAIPVRERVLEGIEAMARESEPTTEAEVITDIAEYLEHEIECGGTSYHAMAQEILSRIPESCPYDCSHCRED